MAILVRSLTLIFKLLLFIGLYALALRLIHTYPVPMPPEQQHILFSFSRSLGIRDPDDLYLSTFAIVDMIIAIMAYRLIMKIWRHCRSKRDSKP